MIKSLLFLPLFNSLVFRNGIPRLSRKSSLIALLNKQKKETQDSNKFNLIVFYYTGQHKWVNIFSSFEDSVAIKQIKT